MRDNSNVAVTEKIPPRALKLRNHHSLVALLHQPRVSTRFHQFLPRLASIRVNQIGDSLAFFELIVRLPHKMEIIDLHNDGFSLVSLLHAGLADGQATVGDAGFETKRSISTMSLYSDEGLSIYESITELKACQSCSDRIERLLTISNDFLDYPFAAELELLTNHGEEIAKRMLGLSTGGSEQEREREVLKDDAVFAPEARVKEKWVRSTL